MGRIWVIVAALACGVFGQATAAPLEAYGRLPSLADLKISPDESSIAFVDTAADGQRSIAVVRISDQKPLIVAEVGKVKVRDLNWVGSQDLMITTSATTSVDERESGTHVGHGEWYFLETLNIPTGRLTKRLENFPNIWNMVDSYPWARIVNGRAYIFVEADEIRAVANVRSLVRIDLVTNDTQVVAHGQQDTRGWMTDVDGQPLAETRYNSSQRLWSLYLRRNGQWMLSKSIGADVDVPWIDGYDRDGTSILVHSKPEEVQAVSLNDGSWRPAPDENFLETLHDDNILRLVGGVRYPSEGGGVTFFDPTEQASWNGVLKAFPGEAVRLAFLSQDQKAFLVHVLGAKDGSSYSLIDLTSHRAIWIGDQYSDVAPADVAEVRSITYAATDGLQIPAVLTLPPGKAARNLPLIVLPHGGPEGWDQIGFDWWAQAMASKGYAVLQPNFRGSDGYGPDFVRAGYGQWGRKMQTDLSDGVRYLTSQGVIDPKRVCIVGASYGGYAALAGAAIDHGVYRCAVAVAGPADLHRLLEDAKDRSIIWTNNLALRYWDRFMDVSGPADPALDAISPALQADKVDIPVLLIHGRDDTVVPFAQSRIMADALKRAGKPVTVVTLDHEDHWLSSSETRQQMLKATVDFVEANNPPN